VIRHRNHVLFLDSKQRLTRGNPLGLDRLMDDLVNAADQVTAVAPAAKDCPDRIGRLRFVNGERTAHLSFILPSEEFDCGETMQLLDGLAVRAGECGCLSLLADLEEDSQAFETFRKCGYSVYTHQKIFRNIEMVPAFGEVDSNWEPITPRSSAATARNLYQALVPPLVQGMEPLPAGQLTGWVGIQDGEMTAYAAHKSGPAGDFVQPIVHPGARDAGGLLNSLFAKIQALSNRPLYVAIRSYQSWLEKFMTEEKWELLPRQVLMVKHLTAYQRIPVTNERRAVLETNPTTEPTAPIAGYHLNTDFNGGDRHT
jgi:hypothetical protein